MFAFALSFLLVLCCGLPFFVCVCVVLLFCLFDVSFACVCVFFFGGGERNMSQVLNMLPKASHKRKWYCCVFLLIVCCVALFGAFGVC